MSTQECKDLLLAGERVHISYSFLDRMIEAESDLMNFVRSVPGQKIGVYDQPLIAWIDANDLALASQEEA